MEATLRPAAGKSLSPSRVRILVAASNDAEPHWMQWQQAVSASEYAQRLIAQRVRENLELRPPRSIALGYGEQLRWFGPIDDDAARSLVLGYAASILDYATFPDLSDELKALSASTADASVVSAVKPSPPTEGIVLMSHAETDLLALERARGELPADFPNVAGFSLIGIDHPQSLLTKIGPSRSRRLTVIVRVHGAASTVTGLSELIATAHEEGWAVVVISGVGAGAELQPRTQNVAAELAADLTAYFMAGGVGNVVNALRCIAHQQLGVAIDYEQPQAMPAHGLYHPDLLVTTHEEWLENRISGRPTAAVLFYRAHVLSGNLQFVDDLVRALESRGFAAIGVYTSSLRDRNASGAPMALGLLAKAPEVVVNTVSFPVFTLSSLQPSPTESASAAFEQINAPLIQAICCGTPRQVWIDSARGLSPTEAAMNIALPECDGRVITVPISFKENHRYQSDPERIARVTGIAQRTAALRTKHNRDKRLAVVLTNSGGKAQKIGGAVGLDTPASLWRWLRELRDAGYEVGEVPDSPEALMTALLGQGGYDDAFPLDPTSACRLPRTDYANWFERQSGGFQDSLQGMWGAPSRLGPTIAPPFWRSNKQSARRSPLLALSEPYSDDEDYLFAGLRLGNVIIAIQPPRGFGVDPEAVYHAPDLPPCHHYAAFYRWIAEVWRADAIVHFGTHGTLEWLPGKSLAMSADCAPDALLGDLPLVYPFVVNNPGEGAQAKRRTHAVIIDHLVPPLTHADTYGPLATLARLVEEYYRTEVLDPSKLPILRQQIWQLVRTAELEEDLKQLRRQRHGDHEHSWDDRLNDQGIPRALESLSGRGFAHLLEDLDAYLCDLGRAQIRGGLHVFGVAPVDSALRDLVFAILKNPNGAIAALPDAVAKACDIDTADLRSVRGLWPHQLAPALAGDSGDRLTVGQVRTSIDDFCRQLLADLLDTGMDSSQIETLIEQRLAPRDALAKAGAQTLADTLRFACETVVPNIERTTDETRHLLGALNGHYVPAGPSGSPSRGMAHVLPTGRNFYTVDPRGLPTQAAWTVGAALAREALNRHFDESQRWPESVALSVWGTPTMRTGGDEIAQALALIGMRPLWDPETRRTIGLEVVSLADLGRPRVDVTLRVSGFFRDAFPALMHLFDDAVQQVARLEEPIEQNFLRKHWLAETQHLIAKGEEIDLAQRRASFRVFSSKPGAYGTGLMELIDSRIWRDAGDLADTFVLWGGWAYSPDAEGGVEATDAFRRRLAGIDLALHNSDNREQDLFDSSDFFEFHGGLVAAAGSISGTAPRAYFGDSSETSQPQMQSLQGEALRVYRSRVLNPKWLSSIQQHGFRGGVEMISTVDCLFGYSATAGVVSDWMYEGIAERYASGESLQFLRRHNPWALNAIVERLLEADQRNLWTPRAETRNALQAALIYSESAVEERAELPT